ncbi:MAG: calcium-binding protein, partial [Acidimicrobiia bacterium]
GVAYFDDRKLAVAGVASAGAEGVDIFYSKSRDRDDTKWEDVQCGYVDLLGTGTGSQEFEGLCTLAGGDRASQVTGIAAVPYDCSANGCDANPNPPPLMGLVATSREGGQRDAGVAHRVFGCAQTPCVMLGPPEVRAVAGSCQVLIATVNDSDGNPLSGLNMDIHVRGPGDEPAFCRPASDDIELSGLRLPTAGHTDGGLHPDVYGPYIHHREGETNAEGHIAFGVTSSQSSYHSIFSTLEFDHTSVVVWADTNGDDQLTESELTSRASLHWELPGRCTQVGTEHDDKDFFGTVEDDKICTLEGIDEVFASDGHDLVLAGVGNDTIHGVGGRVEVRGEFGDDRLEGGDGKDEIIGSLGNDDLYGGFGSDVIMGGSGHDRCFGGRGDDLFRGCEEISDPDDTKKHPKDAEEPVDEEESDDGVSRRSLSSRPV